MEKLREIYRRDPYEFRLVKRSELVAMYALWFMDVEDGDEPRIHCYEVFQIKKQKPQIRVIPGYREVEYREKELYPRNEDFGRTAWAPSSVERAEEIFESLTREAHNQRSLQRE